MAGGLVGAGLGYLLSPDDSGRDDGRLATTAVTIQLTPDLRPDHRGLSLVGSF